MRRGLVIVGLVLACTAPPMVDKVSYAIGTHAPEYWRVGEKIFFEDVWMEGASAIELVMRQTESAEYLRRHVRNRERVFYRGRVIEGAAPDSFCVVEPYTGYAKDATSVYLGDLELPGASPDEFRVLGEGPLHPYARDGATLFYFGRPIARLEGPAPVLGDYALVGSRVFHCGERVDGLLPRDVSIHEYDCDVSGVP